MDAPPIAGDEAPRCASDATAADPAAPALSLLDRLGAGDADDGRDAERMAAARVLIAHRAPLDAMRQLERRFGERRPRFLDHCCDMPMLAQCLAAVFRRSTSSSTAGAPIGVG